VDQAAKDVNIVSSRHGLLVFFITNSIFVENCNNKEAEETSKYWRWDSLGRNLMSTTSDTQEEGQFVATSSKKDQIPILRTKQLITW